MLLAYLADNDAPCPACGYNLRHLRNPTCPECGLSLTLSVGSNESFKRAWAIALCVNAMIAGIGAIFCLLMSAAGEAPTHEKLSFIWFYAPMLWMPVPLVLFYFRRRFCMLATPVQYTLVGLSFFCLILIGVTMVIDMG